MAKLRPEERDPVRLEQLCSRDQGLETNQILKSCSHKHRKNHRNISPHKQMIVLWLLCSRACAVGLQKKDCMFKSCGSCPSPGQRCFNPRGMPCPPFLEEDPYMFPCHSCISLYNPCTNPPFFPAFGGSFALSFLHGISHLQIGSGMEIPV